MTIVKIDLPAWNFPSEFSGLLKTGFNIITIDFYASGTLQDEYILEFASEETFVIRKGEIYKKSHIEEFGRMKLLEALYNEKEYFHSFFIALNEFVDKRGNKVKLASLIYEFRNSITIWTPSFEELFIILIQDDIDNNHEVHLNNIRFIQDNCTFEVDFTNLVVDSHVDYVLYHDKVECFNTAVYYSLMNYIFLLEDEKYPEIPGSRRTLDAYEDLYSSYKNKRIDIEAWRAKHLLKNPWK